MELSFDIKRGKLVEAKLFTEGKKRFNDIFQLEADSLYEIPSKQILKFSASKLIFILTRCNRYFLK